MTRSGRARAAQTAAATAVLACLAVRVGAEPFWAGLRALTATSFLVATALGALATACAAWRWRTIACGVGLKLSMGSAIAGYYASQFLNTALPGGVLGDVHRAVRHGRDTGGVLRAGRTVVLERAAGQAAQVIIAVIALSVLPSPVHGAMPLVIAALAGVAVLAALARKALRRCATNSIIGRSAHTVGVDLRRGVLARHAWPRIGLASVVALACHAATFVVAARAVGSTVPVVRLLPLALLVLLAAAVPLNLGGWGLREGAAAWAFGAAGMGTAHGVATATAYGVLTMAATLPGAVMLVASRSRRQPTPQSESRAVARRPSRVFVGEPARG